MAVKKSDYGKYDILKLLLDNNAVVNTHDDHYNYPIHDAVRANDPETIELLLKQNANVNQQNLLGWTPLHIAAYEGYVDAAKKLLEYHADKNAFVSDGPSKGKTPLNLAERRLHREMILLLNPNAVLEKPPQPPVEKNPQQLAEENKLLKQQLAEANQKIQALENHIAQLQQQDEFRLAPPDTRENNQVTATRHSSTFFANKADKPEVAQENAVKEKCCLVM